VRRAEPLLLAWVAALGIVLALGVGLQATAQTAKKERDGKWQLPNGDPTYNIAPDGTVDWYTYSGYRRYNSECIVCHGPDGEGSSFAPALDQSVKTLSYADFLMIVAGGRQAVGTAKQNVMPAFGDNPNVMCYIDDIYIYLKARADGAVPRGRPAKRADKPATATKNENACFGK
jgi:methanol metabolism-related c-type cytochrome